MEGVRVQLSWILLYFLASIWIVGLIMSVLGLPFGPDGMAAVPVDSFAHPLA